MAVRVLFFLSTVLFTLSIASAAPKSYDQRQDGQYNVHAQLENFLFLVVVPSNNNLLSELALQALELKQQLISRSNPLKEHGSDSTSFVIYKSDEEKLNKDPVNIVQIDKSHPNKGSLVKDAEGENTKTLEIPNQQHSISVVITDEQDKLKDVGRKAKSLKSLQYVKNREVPTILGYLIDTREIVGSKVEDGRGRKIVGNAWNPDFDPGRSGASLKKQLFHKEQTKENDAEENILPSLNANRNNVAFSKEKQ